MAAVNETFEKVKRRIDLKLGRKTAETMDDLKAMFSMVCVNAMPATRSDGTRQDYRHPDLDAFSQEAFENGKSEFYCKPANPENPNGRQVKTEPEYQYRLTRHLSKEEFELLFSKHSVKKEEQS